MDNQPVQNVYKRKKSIQASLLRYVLVLVFSTMLATCVVNLIGMLRVRKSSLDNTESFSKDAAEIGKDALLSLTRDNIADIVHSNALYSNATLCTYQEYVNYLANFAAMIQEYPEDYMKFEVEAPKKRNAGEIAFSRYLTSKDISLEEISDDIGLMANLEEAFYLLLSDHMEDFVAIYYASDLGYFLFMDYESNQGKESKNEFEIEPTYDFKDTEWYQLALQAEKPIFSDTYYDGLGKGRMITCACPVRDSNGNFYGAIGIDILVDDLAKNLLNATDNNSLTRVLFNKNLDTIVSNNGEVPVENIKNAIQEDIIKLQQEDPDLSKGVVVSDDNYFYAFSLVEEADWTIALCIPKSQILQPVEKIQTSIHTKTDIYTQETKRLIMIIISSFLCVHLVFSIFIFWLVHKNAKRATRAVVQLKEDAEIIASGNLDHRTFVQSQSELGVLANAFNSMAQSMQEYIKKVTKVTAENERIGTELDIAANIQASMVPNTFPAFPGQTKFDIFGSMDPAKEMCGDLFDFFMLDSDHLAFLIADVTGKGVPAGIYMVVAKTLLKLALQSGLSPDKALEQVNVQISEYNSMELFVTVWIGILELSTGKLVCSNAGHEYPAIRRKNEAYEILHDKHGVPVAWMPDSEYTKYELTLYPGDRIFVYTDGVLEATNSENQLFGTERMLEALNKEEAKTCEDQLRLVRESVDAFVKDAPQFDDLTMLCLEYFGNQNQNEEG